MHMRGPGLPEIASIPLRRGHGLGRHEARRTGAAGKNHSDFGLLGGVQGSVGIG